MTVSLRLGAADLVRDRPVRHLLELADEAQLIVVGNGGAAASPG
ncbi:hypothetical protein [Rhodococcus opacus]|uniref:Universal stress protein n=1 Tax=Rhodococcus opacus RKJ300 = JCM 13270 TaxID=1165867 RepID=I0WTT4_RHOOP|nr:universal stress protein [Rhodococcus opacus RKJ300 = JCM 13270]